MMICYVSLFNRGLNISDVALDILPGNGSAAINRPLNLTFNLCDHSY